MMNFFMLFLLKLLTNNKSGTVHLAVQNLWQSLINNVFVNYSGKEIKNIISWISIQITSLKEKAEEISDHDLNQLNVIFELIYLISTNSKINEEGCLFRHTTQETSDHYSGDSKPGINEENSLIKIQAKNHYDLDLYILISPVLFWCDFSIEKESRISIFKPAWKSLVSILEALPIDTNSELIPIVLPYLEQIHNFAIKSSPTLSMLKFINLILKPIKKHSTSNNYPYHKMHKKLIKFLLSFILRFSKWIPHNLNEEAFKVLDSLLYTVRFSLKYVHIKTVTLALLDKYTMRSKIHKETMATFINLLLDQENYIESDEFSMRKDNYIDYFLKVIIDEPNSIHHIMKELHQESVDFLEKVNLINLMIKSMDNQQLEIFDSIVRNKQLIVFLCQMIQTGVTSICLKAIEIIQNFIKYYIQSRLKRESENEHEIQQSAEDEQTDYEMQNISHTRLYLIKLIINTWFASIDTYSNTNAYIEFGTLSLLSSLFHSIMPAPSFSNEIYKNQNPDINDKKVRQSEIPDLRDIDPQNLPQFDVIDPIYLSIRLDIVFRVWDYAQNSLESKWSNIRKLTYRLLACMLRISSWNYCSILKKKLKNNFPVLLNILLESNNSEAKKGGLYILGSFCGLGYDWEPIDINIRDNLRYFKKYEVCNNTKTLWQKVFELQNDWDPHVRDAANILVQFWAPYRCIKNFKEMENEKYDLKLSEIQNKIRSTLISRWSKGIALKLNLGTGINEWEEADEAFEADEISSNIRDYSSQNQLNNEIHSSSSENNSYKYDTDDEFYERYFYINKYENKELKMLIRLFILKVTNSNKDYENKFNEGVLNIYCSVPNSLWTEKQNSNTQSINNHKPHDNLSNERITDFVEDNLDAVNENKQSELKENPYDYAWTQAIKSIESKGLENKSDQHEDSEYLIFERHFESKPFGGSEECEKDEEIIGIRRNIDKEKIFDEEINTDDLGIIDLEDDLFDNIDDDKLPFLKNTYSKKNRPNNSKSVAAGSKSKANRIDFGREDIGPGILSKDKSEESTPERLSTSDKFIEKESKIKNLNFNQIANEESKTEDANIVTEDPTIGDNLGSSGEYKRESNLSEEEAEDEDEGELYDYQVLIQEDNDENDEFDIQLEQKELENKQKQKLLFEPKEKLHELDIEDDWKEIDLEENDKDI